MKGTKDCEKKSAVDRGSEVNTCGKIKEWFESQIQDGQVQSMVGSK